MKLNVSIVIPCYNASPYLGEAVDSCLQQDYQYISEIIIVDNNSKDNTLLIAENLSMKDKRIKVVIENQQGANFARNTGLKFTTGDWIQFLDADDVLLPNKISAQMELISQSKVERVGIIFGAFIQNDRPRLLQDKGSPFWGLLAGGLHCGSTPSNLWKSSAVKSVNGFNTKKSSSQETDLIFRILKEDYNVIVHNEPLTRVIDRGNSDRISNQNINIKIFNFFELRFEILNYIKDFYPNFFISNRLKTIELYRLLLNRLMHIETNDENDLIYRMKVFKMLNSLIYCPFWLKIIPANKRYKAQLRYFMMLKSNKIKFIDKIVFKLEQKF